MKIILRIVVVKYGAIVAEDIKLESKIILEWYLNIINFMFKYMTFFGIISTVATYYSGPYKTV
tara:strand:- start:244 stop:432 length:189 start_codon:yes stop_codon:yes gene_type:complete